MRYTVVPGVLLVALFITSGISDAQTVPTGFTHQSIYTGFDQPVGMTFLPDGRIIVIEQRTARVKVFSGGAVGTLGTVPNVNAAGNEQGLLGVAADPAWPTRPYLYFHHDVVSPPSIQIVMCKITGDLQNPASTNLSLGAPYVLLDGIPDAATNHNGGTCRFGPDGMLYVSIGDDANQCMAQDVRDLRGVILRLDVSTMPQPGSGPPAKSLITPQGNPFGGPNDNARLTWAYGLRNPFRFSIDPVTGYLYIADVGQGKWEELSESKSGGENFGWPWYEGPNRYASCSGSLPPTVLPIGGYDRSNLGPASIVSFTCYRNRLGGTANFGNAYEGDVFFAEYYDGFVRRIQKNGATWAPASPVPGQPDPVSWALNIRYAADALVGPDGAIYYLSQFPAGALNRIAFNPRLPEIVCADTAKAGQPFPVRSERASGDLILLALGFSTIPPTPLPGFFGTVEIIGYPIATGLANASGQFDVTLPVPAAAVGITAHFQCVAVDGADNFISPVKKVTVVP